MKTISLLGSIFLPATLLASIFSMTFFNFQNGKHKDSSIRARSRGKKTRDNFHSTFPLAGRASSYKRKNVGF